ncbi:PAS domain-containing protein [Geobacter argillaceus]|uniref:histidine kinase n=1 Tax=Geobacter argillaceus TaxID=345631 RepID=A0A562VK60_9BACT|nr:PAS domain-containing protein [Geobacter argillaceus]TWJ18366.1 hypothetical protein JN12_02586 [Geobacter argillaceus]
MHQEMRELRRRLQEAEEIIRALRSGKIAEPAIDSRISLAGIRKDVAPSDRIQVESTTEDALQKANDELELKVRERTAELVRANEALQTEIAERKRVEDALRKSEALYRAIGESIEYGVWVCAPDGRNIYASDSFLKMVGITRQQCSDFGWGDVLHPDDAEQTISKWKECVASGGAWDIEHRFRGVDGIWHHVLARGVPVRDEQGEILCWAGINLDISRLKDTEQSLRETSQRLKLIVETANLLLASGSPQDVVDNLCRKVMAFLDCQLFFNFLVDENANRLHLNACAGISETEADGIRWLDIGTAVCGCVARDGCRIVTENISGSNDPRTELVRSFGIQAYACHPLVSKQRVIGTLSFGSRSKTSFTDNELELMKTVADQVALAMERHIGEQERESLLRELALEKSRWQTTVNNLLDPVTICDASGCVTYINPAYQRLIERPLNADLAVADHADYYQLYRPDGSLFPADELPLQKAALTGTEVKDVELIQRAADGREFVAIFSAAPLRDTYGQVIGAVAVGHDITQLRRAERSLQKAYDELEKRVAERTSELASTVNALMEEAVEREKAEQALRVETEERLRAMELLREKDRMLMQQGRQAALGEMIGNIAHQWLQPLNNLGLLIQELPISYAAGEFSGEYLEQSVNRAMQMIYHMSQTIDGFRNFFRPDKEKRLFSVSAELTNTLNLLTGSFREFGIQCDIVTSEELMIEGFPNEFSQVLLNILLNARDAFIERNVVTPRVQAALFREHGRAVITITDNAGGISEEIMDRIFDPYFTTKGPDKGTGVGLFMSKTIIESNMHGTLRARNIDHGAEFRIEI